MNPRRLVGVVIVAVLVFGPASSALGQPSSPSSTQKGGAPGITAASAILISLDEEGGRVLFKRGVHAQRPPASLTKIATALVARDEYQLDEVVTASPLVLQTHGSDLGLEPGMRITVRNLLYSLMLKSANDAAVALAAHHPLGYNHFVDLINAKARSLGAFDTHFVNPHGLDAIGHVSSAWDMALLGRELMADPVLAGIVASKSHTMPWRNGGKRIFDNHNKLVNRDRRVIGMKTGYTQLAGHCLVTAARTPYGTVITVVLASQDHYKDSLALIDYATTIENRVASGGGSVDVGEALTKPPTAPDEVLASSPLGGLDPRDDARWLGLMLGLAFATAATLTFRRRSDPLLQAAELASQLEQLQARRLRR
jgi:serine-type D-Ala-D-Ala carboxypeptidase (penicillin-binding protein 5/6)